MDSLGRAAGEHPKWHRDPGTPPRLTDTDPSNAAIVTTRAEDLVYSPTNTTIFPGSATSISSHPFHDYISWNEIESAPRTEFSAVPVDLFSLHDVSDYPRAVSENPDDGNPLHFSSPSISTARGSREPDLFHRPDPSPIQPSASTTGNITSETSTSSTSSTFMSDSIRSSRPLTQRERNRIAAHKCRQKAKLNVEDLQERERALAKRRASLSAEVGFLKNQVLDLKNQVLSHGTCDCEPIQNYIAQAAKRL